MRKLFKADSSYVYFCTKIEIVFFAVSMDIYKNPSEDNVQGEIHVYVSSYVRQWQSNIGLFHSKRITMPESAKKGKL